MGQREGFEQLPEKAAGSTDLLLGPQRISVTLSLGRTGILERIYPLLLSLGQGERAEEEQSLAYTHKLKILGLF